MYTNVDTLTNKTDELKAYVKHNKPDIILVAEVLPKSNQNIPVHKITLQLENYTMFHNFDMQSCHRGLAIYVNKGVSVMEVSYDEETETLWISVSSRPLLTSLNIALV